MLYVSRLVAHDSIGVVDTDDEVEEVLSLAQLTALRKSCDIPIEGVIPDETGKNPFKWIRVHQLDKYVKPCQVKAKLAMSLDIQTWHDMVTIISWEPEDIKTPLTIRLSDFGSSCGDRILFMTEPVREHKLTLILDDKIKFTRFTFRRWLSKERPVGKSGVGVVFDIRELTNDRLAKVLYMSLNDTDGADKLFDSVIDSDVRKHEMRKTFLGLLGGGKCYM